MHKAKKRFGQNFLLDPGIRSHILAAGAPKKGDEIIEIGPGLGALTDPILRTGAKLTAIEIDHDLIESLQNRFGGNPNFGLLQQDALKLDWAGLLADKPGAKLIANLPYNISSPLFFLLTKERMRFQSLTLMLQKEVAYRMSWQPKDSKKEYGALSVAAQLMFDLERICFVPPEAFTPRPKVDSAVIRLTPKKTGLAEEAPFLSWLRQAFNQRRKLLYKAFGADFEKLPPSWQTRVKKARPEELSPTDYLELYQAMAST